MSLPTLNQPAPTFSALNQRSEEVNSSDLVGKKVLLYFYPKAMTPGCTTQACGLRDSLKQFQQRNCVVLGISPDSPEKLQKFIERDQLNFDLLSDPDHRIADRYGVWGLKKFMGREYEGVHRISFLIDEHGILRHIMDKVATKTHHDDMLAIIDAL